MRYQQCPLYAETSNSSSHEWCFCGQQWGQVHTDSLVLGLASILFSSHFILHAL